MDQTISERALPTLPRGNYAGAARDLVSLLAMHSTLGDFAAVRELAETLVHLIDEGELAGPQGGTPATVIAFPRARRGA